MRDWCKEMPPGTLLVSKDDRTIMALVVCVRSPPGDMVHMIVLTNRSELRELSCSFYLGASFYDTWLKVLT